jgi:hypothetical protein
MREGEREEEKEVVLWCCNVGCSTNKHMFALVEVYMVY